MQKQEIDNSLFKKLDDKVWEFRIRYNRTQIRVLAFWDKRKTTETLVVAASGFVKKQSKIPKKEIQKAHSLRELYFDNKQ